jgi:hypothetical protein
MAATTTDVKGSGANTLETTTIMIRIMMKYMATRSNPKHAARNDLLKLAVWPGDPGSLVQARIRVATIWRHP